MAGEEVKIDLSRLSNSHFEASRGNAIEANKVSAGLSANLFTISVFFIGFIATSSKIIERVDAISIIFIAASMLSGLVSIFCGIFSMLYSRLRLIQMANKHLSYAKYVQDWIIENKKSFIDKIPEKLKFEQSIIKGNERSNLYGRIQAYSLFIQILLGVLVFLTSFIDINIHLK